MSEYLVDGGPRSETISYGCMSLIKPKKMKVNLGVKLELDPEMKEIAAAFLKRRMLEEDARRTKFEAL